MDCYSKRNAESMGTVSAGSPSRMSPSEADQACLIVNPSSGRGLEDETLVGLKRQLETRWPRLETVVTESASDIEAVAQDAVRKGLETVIVLGGDGTLNGVVNGVAAIDGALERTIFGVLPGGTGNDFAGTLGFVGPLSHAAELLSKASPRPIDLGMMNDRIFTNASAGGLFAEASEATSQSAKSLAGRLAYWLAGPRVLLEHEDVELSLRGQTPEGRIEWHGTISMFAVCNAPTAGGGTPFAPFARYDDGWLDVFIVEETSTLGLTQVLLQLSGGTHLLDDRVTAFRVSELDLHFDRPTRVNVDGEIGVHEHAHYRVLPMATRMLAPSP